ncbi:hypothetical protein CR513_54624, partial [Mucuna pruriens]
MEEEINPIRQQQRRLNSTILDVVKKEVPKLLVAGIIYPISDSQWKSPVQSWKSYRGNPITSFWMASHGTCKFILHLKISTRLPSPAHLAPSRTLACHLDCVTLRVHSSVV